MTHPVPAHPVKVVLSNSSSRENILFLFSFLTNILALFFFFWWQNYEMYITKNNIQTLLESQNFDTQCNNRTLRSRAKYLNNVWLLFLCHHHKTKVLLVCQKYPNLSTCLLSGGWIFSFCCAFPSPKYQLGTKLFHDFTGRFQCNFTFHISACKRINPFDFTDSWPFLFHHAVFCLFNPILKNTRAWFKLFVLVFCRKKVKIVSSSLTKTKPRLCRQFWNRSGNQYDSRPNTTPISMYHTVAVHCLTAEQ